MTDKPTPHSAQPLERRLATILCADVAGYSQMMGVNEDRTVRIFSGHREIFESLVKMHRGRIFNTAGDALLAEFNSAVEAVRCATEIQAALRTRNEHLEPEEKMQFRMGINLGDVIIQGGDLLGDGVNVAARIQASTTPGGICISGSVHDQIRNKLSLEFKPMGEQTFKNIASPVRTYTVSDGVFVTPPARKAGWLVPVLVSVAVVALAGAGYWGYQQYGKYRVAQPPVQKQAAAQDPQLQAQKKAAEEELRRAQEERKKLEQERKQLEAGTRSAKAARPQEKIAQLQPEQKRIEADRRAAEAARKHAEKQAAGGAGKPAEDIQRPAPATAKPAAKPVVSHDGTYNGKLCRQDPSKDAVCWSVPLTVRNGTAECSWVTRSTQKTASARGPVAADGSVTLNLSTWALNGTPFNTTLRGTVNDGAMNVSGRLKNGGLFSGTWNRAN
jgi:class 3 adenylate cyclase